MKRTAILEYDLLNEDDAASHEYAMNGEILFRIFHEWIVWLRHRKKQHFSVDNGLAELLHIIEKNGNPRILRDLVT